MSKLLSYLGVTEHQLLIVAALCAASLFAGMALASGWAADEVLAQASAQVKAARVEAQQAKVVQDAAVHKALDLKAKADAASAQALGEAAQAAELRAQLAHQYIAKEQEHAQNVTPTVVGNAALRRVLNNAAGVCLPSGEQGAGAVDANPGECSSTADLTVKQLQDGYVNLGRAFVTLRSFTETLQQNIRDQGLGG